MTNDTIFACASGAGPSAIAVYRLSGANTDAVLSTLLQSSPPAPRRAALRSLWSPVTNQVFDKAVVIRFLEGGSYTGELSAELQIHGGLAVRAALEAALEASGARIAQPGEFTRRAFLAGRMDLAQAEGVAALIEAETEAQRLQALEILDGVVGRRASEWRSALLEIGALIETGIDFVEEGIEETIRAEALQRVEALGQEFAEISRDPVDSGLDLQAPLVALIGRPNAGKSSLLNAIVQNDVAIVSPTAGTTRDPVRTDILQRGVRIRLVDTAGIRDASDEIEQIGVERAWAHAERADLRILVVSSDSGWPDAQILESLRQTDAVFWTKADEHAPTPSELGRLPSCDVYIVSSQDESAGQAFESLVRKREMGRRPQSSPIAGTARRARLLASASEAVERAGVQLKTDRAEAAAEECREAARIVAQLTGSIDHEDVLDTLFSRFCIGK